MYQLNDKGDLNGRIKKKDLRQDGCSKSERKERISCISRCERKSKSDPGMCEGQTTGTEEAVLQNRQVINHTDREAIISLPLGYIFLFTVLFYSHI